jgi:hypothetical protein
LGHCFHGFFCFHALQPLQRQTALNACSQGPSVFPDGPVRLVFFARFPQRARTRIIFASVLEEFACLPEFVLVSTIVLIGSVRPNQCLGVTLFSYFRFLFVTHKNYGVKRQGNLLTKISLLHVSTSVRQYASTSVHQYVSTPLCGMAAVRQYISMSVRQYVSTSVRQYAMLPKLYKPQQRSRCICCSRYRSLSVDECRALFVVVTN